MSNLLIMDQGTHASRALLVSPNGEIIDHAEQNISLNRLSHEMVEQDAEEILQSIQDALSRLSASELGKACCAALTTQRSTLLAWHSDTGRAISPAISWQDRRSSEALASLQTYAEEIKHITGLPLSPHYGAGKLRWLLQHHDRVMQALHTSKLRMGPLAGFLLSRLLQQDCHLIDHSNAQRTQLFDLQRRDWSPRLLELFDIPRSVLPRCTPMLHPYGRLRQHAIPLNCVCGDQNAALHGQGTIAVGQALINIGTGAFLLAPCEAPIVDTPLLCGIAFSQDAHCQYLLEGTVNGAGAALDWAQHHFPQDELFQQLPHWLQQVTQPPLFINTVGGLGSPWWLSGEPPRFLGDTTALAAERYVAIIESIVFLLQQNIEQLQQKIPLTALVISGGLSQLEGLCQKLADLSRLPVSQLGTTEATALGAAWLLANQPQHWLRQQPRHYAPAKNPPLQHRYQTFCKEISRQQNPV